MRRTATLLLAPAVLTGCGVTPPAPSPAPAPGAEAPAIAIHPASARPGDELAMQFSHEGIRGIAFSLDGWDGTTWRPLYVLTSDGQSAHREPAWWRAGESGRGWVDVAVTGPGPEHVVVPRTAPAGDYRVCTADAATRSCGLLTVEE